MAMLTPREAIQFSANMRLKLPQKDKNQRVNEIIKDLGLESCQNTTIGNTMIKGISGGERKRTSIGVELITNPSLIYLDEPTTGLDSVTALQITRLLA